jgi:tetratricopeptide (TPR) repeat protein
VLLAALLVVGVSAFAWLMRRQFPYVFVGWFWYVGTAVPVINLVQLCSQSIADRYTYVPAIGVAIIVVWGLHALTARWPDQAIAALVGGALLLCACVALTRYEIGFWKDGETVWKRALAVTKDNYVAYCCYGIIIGSTDPDQALIDFQESVRIKPGFAEAERCLATALHQRGRLDEAILHYQAAGNSNPYDDRPQFGLAIAYSQKGETDEAISHFQKALAINPDDWEYMNDLALLLAQKNRFAEAVPLLKKVCDRQTSSPGAYNNLGIVLMKTGQFAEAVGAFQTAVKLAPDSAGLQANLAAAINAGQQHAVPPTSTTNQPPH